MRKKRKEERKGVGNKRKKILMRVSLFDEEGERKNEREKEKKIGRKDLKGMKRCENYNLVIIKNF